MIQKLEVQAGKVVPSSGESAPILVVLDPDAAERRHLVDTLGVDEHTLNSALDPDEVSRVEFEPEHLAVVFKRPKTYRAEDALVFKVLSTGLFLFERRLVVVVSDDMPVFEGKPIPASASPSDLMLRLLSSTIAHFLGHMRTITLIADQVEAKVNLSMENRHLLSLFTLEKSLVYYLNALNANSAVIEKLRNNASRAGFSREQQELLEDLAIENQQCYRQAEIYSNILSSLMDARASIVSNNLNQLIKTLTIITIAIMLPTLVVSAFSMNVTIPLQRNTHAFWVIMLFALISASAVVTLWRLRKW
jgi:magnesium transporter